jgi:hypothetical protein
MAAKGAAWRINADEIFFNSRPRNAFALTAEGLATRNSALMLNRRSWCGRRCA